MWSEIVAAAVIGSERRALKVETVTDPLSRLIARFEQSDGERNLLAAAAAAALYLRAGRVPIRDDRPLPEACTQDDIPRCSPRAGEHLKFMLSGMYQELLPEWLSCMAIAGQRVPEESLPSLLDLGTGELSGAILAVLGERGKWLIAQSANWKAFISYQDGSVWEEGSSEQRLAYLELLRKRDPACARDLLAGVWEQEAPKNRSDLLQKLASGLSLADEPFLERALDDRSAAVRRTAADLLSRLPESAFVERMRQRAKSHVSFKKRTIGKIEIEITLPEERDERMVRDAVVKVPPHSQIGERAWWLQQILSAVPPGFWLQLSECSVNELLKMARMSEWSRLLLNGWSRAAIGFGEIEWVECLLEISSDYLPAEDLFAVLPPARKEAIVGKMLNRVPSRSSIDQLYWCFKGCRHRWSEEFSRAVVKRMSRQQEMYAMRNDIVLRNVLTMIVCHLHPSAIPEAMSGMNGVAERIGTRAPLLDHFLSMMQFRSEMLGEIDL
jgi:Family of unknown function (DUF5691)